MENWHLNHRNPDRPASVAAAHSLGDKSTIYAALLDAYRAAGTDGLTDEEAATMADLPSGAWKRCSDLRRDGLITQTVFTRKASSGRRQMVCVIAGGKP